jgi:hypothetical protein
VWKITPLFASWITSPGNPFFRHDIVSSTSSILELGCGISGIIGLSLSPFVKSYTLTDQEYVAKLVKQNLLENTVDSSTASKGRKSSQKTKKVSKSAMELTSDAPESNVKFMPLDWEQDEVLPSLTGRDDTVSFDAVIACDCIYNDALVAPLVQTCVDACKLRQLDTAAGQSKPTVCIIAQQLRSPEVFEAWLSEFHKSFRVWKIPDSDLIEGLREDTGFVVHAGILR